ncbi:hypothetical protein F4775DRAFT_589811 [Biscogniauxia sp. FL1348]|nr:hypothetical protein F4775DRAFT_589811 [Biscogniauxia sp. FL1348]
MTDNSTHSYWSMKVIGHSQYLSLSEIIGKAPNHWKPSSMLSEANPMAIFHMAYPDSSCAPIHAAEALVDATKAEAEAEILAAHRQGGNIMSIARRGKSGFHIHPGSSIYDFVYMANLADAHAGRQPGLQSDQRGASFAQCATVGHRRADKDSG